MLKFIYIYSLDYQIIMIIRRAKPTVTMLLINEPKQLYCVFKTQLPES